MTADEPMTGHCTCGAVRYALHAPPLIVHACHCLDCQRLTGSAFVINIWIERAAVELTEGEPASYEMIGPSGNPHAVHFCETCGTQLWSRYDDARGDTLFVRAGTLERPDEVAPDVHIYTRSKQSWMRLSDDSLTFEAFYELDEVWSPESLRRLQQVESKRSR